jgi:tRNA(Arg) A34 adenosine deaminase TadA
MTLPDLEAKFAHASTERTHHRDQHLGIVACREALAAARAGNYGVGAVLVDPSGSILEQGRNTDIEVAAAAQGLDHELDVGVLR